jgi:predicted PurR-regulated permease PerM
MSITRRLPTASRPGQEDTATKWKRRRDIPIAILAWIGVIAVILWGIMHVIRTVILLIIAGMLAFALAPGVRLLERYLPRSLAILITCLVALSSLGAFFYLVTDTAFHQFHAFSYYLVHLIKSNNGQKTQIYQILTSFGITSEQLTVIRQQLVSHLESSVGNALPFISKLVNSLLDMVVVAVMTIYFLIDGTRINTWCRKNLPYSLHADFLLDTLERVISGYIRGQLLLALVIGLLVGIGMTLFHVPFAILLGVIAFILAFVPILGTLISGVFCTLIALSQGWIIALAVLIYFIIVHVIESDIIGPRIIGKAIGLHPIISLAALITGAELFGIVGALLASPIAGLAQAFIISFWDQWRKTHPEYFVRTKIKTEAGEIDEESEGS